MAGGNTAQLIIRDAAGALLLGNPPATAVVPPVTAAWSSP
jgi:hypothetical protein